MTKNNAEKTIQTKPGNKPGAKPPMQKAAPGTTKRIFGYIFQYKWRVVAIVICILIGAAAQAGSALFLQSLIDTYILPDSLEYDARSDACDIWVKQDLKALDMTVMHKYRCFFSDKTIQNLSIKKMPREAAGTGSSNEAIYQAVYDAAVKGVFKTK